MATQLVSHETIARAITPKGENVYLPSLEQQQIVEAPLQPLLVTAGAGSGKTQTMMNRVLWLVANGHVAPSEVIGLTFTRKATEELRQRLLQGLARLQEAGVISRDDVDVPEVSTYNSFADRIYRQNALLIGYEPDAQLLDEAGAFALMRDVIVSSKLPELAELEKVHMPTLVASALKLSGEMCDNEVTSEDICAHYEASQLAVERFAGTKGFSTVYTKLFANFPRLILNAKLADEYQQRKRDLGMIEFADQVVLARRAIATDPAIAAELRAKFKLIIFDEYQDTSVSQVKLLSEIFSGCGVTAVGDPKQSIYGWRGASSENMAAFYRDFGGHVGAAPLTLSTSFRNDKNILDAANKIARNLKPADFKNDQELKPTAEAATGNVSLKFFEHELDESEAVAEWVKSCLEATPESTAAVLVRTRAQMEPIIEQLEQRNIPFDMVERGGLLRTPEVAHVVSVLRAAANPYAGNELIRLLTGAQFELGLADIVRIASLARVMVRRDPRTGGTVGPHELLIEQSDPQAIDSAASLIEALEYLRTVRTPERYGLSELGLTRCREAAQLLHDVRVRLQLPPTQLIEYCIERSGVREEVLANPDIRVGDANLDALIAAVNEYSAAAVTPDLGAFLDWLEVASDRDEHGAVVEVKPQKGVVQVLTMHAAKGLEWDAVALPGLAHGTLPNLDKSAIWTQSDALPNELRQDVNSLPTINFAALETTEDLIGQVNLTTGSDQHEEQNRATTFVARQQIMKREEGRRLFYVAITRAKHHLWMSCANVKRNRKTIQLPSEFLFDLNDKLPVIASTHSTTTRAGKFIVDKDGQPICFTVDSLTEKSKDEGSAIARLEAVIDRSHEASGAWTTWPEPPMPEQKLNVVKSLAEQVRQLQDEPADVEETDDALDWLVTMLLQERDQHTERNLALPTRFGASKLSDIVNDSIGVARQLARPMPQRPYTATLIGNLFHQWVESLFSAQIVGGQLFGEGEFLDEDETDAALLLVSDADREQLSKLQDTFLNSRFASAELTPVGVEIPINMPIGTFTLVGKIDAVYEHGDGSVEIIDWKTGRAPNTSEEVTARELQLMCYAHAYSAGYDVPIERIRATLYYLPDDREISVREIPPLGTIQELLEQAQARVESASEQKHVSD